MQKEIPKDTIKCMHCFGSGICSHAVERSSKHEHYFYCDKCGKGVPAQLNETYRPPVCAVCGGKGYIRV